MPSMSERDRFVSLVDRLAFDFRSQVESETLHSAILHVYDRLREQLEAQSVTYQDNLTEIQLLKAQLENYNNAMPNLTWTRERPREPGWYWWREKINTCPDWIVRVVDIIEYPTGTLHVSGHGLCTRLDGEFAGPIPQPKEPV